MSEQSKIRRGVVGTEIGKTALELAIEITELIHSPK